MARLLISKVARLQQYIPEIQVDDVIPGPSGVRAQVSMAPGLNASVCFHIQPPAIAPKTHRQALSKTGQLVEDFLFDTGRAGTARRMLHVVNAPSPGATSSLAIASSVVERACAHFNL